MADSFLIDTNILLRIARRSDPEYPMVLASVEGLLNAGGRLLYTHQNIAEFWNVWTRPVNRNGFGLDEISAEQEIARFEMVMELAAEGAAVYRKWRELVRNYAVRGVQVHDARLVAAMLVHRIPKLLTLNNADFERYRGIIEPVHPASIVSTR